jgi:hypothetical chaperone protein
MTSPLNGSLGIDFGTSNSAIAWAEGAGLARALPLEGGASSMPTALFFNAEDHTLHYGRDAMALYLAGTEGRLMRSLKSLLGSPLLHEQTVVDGRQISFLDIIALYLKELRQRAGQSLGTLPDRVVLGRPVHFVDDDAEKDALAQTTLAEAAREAGFRHIAFELEPIAAAFDFERRIDRAANVLIVDIGGGTSDFTVVRLGPDRVAQPDRTRDVLATTGVHIGGTDFDQNLNLEEVMPLMGYRHTGPSGREVPSSVFFHLATWHLINLLGSPRWLADARALRSDYAELALHTRLMRVLQARDGHRIASAVESAKIAVSSTSGRAAIDLAFIDAHLHATLTPDALGRHLATLLARVVACAQDCVAQAGLGPSGVDSIYLTGGSSALAPFQAALALAFPHTPLLEGDLFGGVAAGLAYTGARPGVRPGKAHSRAERAVP